MQLAKTQQKKDPNKVTLSLLTLFLFLNYLWGDIHVFNRKSGSEFELKTIEDSNNLYVSTKDIAKSLNSKLYENSERKKLVIYASGRKIKISGGTSYIIIDDKSYQIFRETKIEYGDIYVPAESFFNLLKKTIQVKKFITHQIVGLHIEYLI